MFSHHNIMQYKNDILKIIKKGPSSRDVKNIIEFCRDFDGLEMAKRKAEIYSQRALESISGYPDSEYKKSAEKFVEYVLARKK